MKKIILSSAFLLMTVTSFAQQAVYYALDGSEWVSETHRDAQEIILWETLSEDIKYMKVNGRCTSDYFDTFSEMFELYKSAISDIRIANVYAKKTIDSGEYKEIKNHIKLEPTIACNGETFYRKEFRELFDLIVDQYNMISTYHTDIINLHKGRSIKRPRIDLDRYVENNNKIGDLGKVLRETSQKLQNEKAPIDKSEALRIVADEIRGVKKGLYYTIDGKEYKTLKGRDNYETRLTKKYKERFDVIKTDMKYKESAQYLEQLLFDNLDYLKNARTINDLLSFLRDEAMLKKVKKTFPNRDFTTYIARNNDTCYIKEVYDWYDQLLGLFEIYDNTLNYMEQIDKEGLKNKDKTFTITELISYMDKQKDARGNTHTELFNDSLINLEAVTPIASSLIKYYLDNK